MAGEFLDPVPGLVQRACDALAQAFAATCPEHLSVKQSDWCVGARACHQQCMLKAWYHETGDPMFQERSRACAGRCMAWDRCRWPNPDAEYWRGHWFTRSEEVDMRRLGYHAQHCPLWAHRNVAEQMHMRCQANVFEESQVVWMSAALETLSAGVAMLSNSKPTSSDLWQFSLRIETMIHVPRMPSSTPIPCLGV